ncbi:hypothetical protein GL263_07080, partial [Streptomyces durbertensis]|nr:hypothetical protein [Streptomyces durbertensis]
MNKPAGPAAGTEQLLPPQRTALDVVQRPDSRPAFPATTVPCSAVSQALTAPPRGARVVPLGGRTAAMPRAAAVAAARRAVRRSRARLAAQRVAADPACSGAVHATVKSAAHAERTTPTPSKSPPHEWTPTESSPVPVPVPGSPSRLAGLRLAVSERLPLWLRERCAMELRSMVAVAVVLL